jgi:hypothetical protein
MVQDRNQRQAFLRTLSYYFHVSVMKHIQLRFNYRNLRFKVKNLATCFGPLGHHHWKNVVW